MNHYGYSVLSDTLGVDIQFVCMIAYYVSMMNCVEIDDLIVILT